MSDENQRVRTRERSASSSAEPVKRARWVHKKQSLWASRDFQALVAIGIGCLVVALTFWLME